MSSDPESSFINDNLQEKMSVENKVPRSPAVAAYESYAAWRKKKCPPRVLDCNAEDYTTQNSNENFSNKNQSNPAFKKSSYFPNEDPYNSENHSNHNHPDSMLPRSSYFSIDSENLISRTKNDQKRRSFPSYENNPKYNPKMFQGNEQEFHMTRQNNPNIIRSSSPGNTISREAQHCLKIYSTRSDNSSSPSSLNPGYSAKMSSPHSPTSQYSGNPKTSQRAIQNSNQLRKSPGEYYPRLSPNTGALQPVRHKSNHRHSFPSCCPMDHKSRESENGEMVKGLLKLIDNQNEQIKNLQSQLDRLLSIHEETLKERAKCICSLEIARQNPQICMQAYNAALHTKSAAIAADSYSNQGLSQFPESNQVSNECSNRRNVQFEDHSKKTLMERKVSIGVMTSFEFTVQNSPFNHDSENPPVIEEPQEEQLYNESVPTNVDLSKRKQNLFSLMPSPLENIIEDSESHISSSQQPSSNCLSSCKSGNLQIQNGRCRNTTPGNNANYANNPNNLVNNNNFNKTNSPSNFNRSTSPSNFNRSNSPSNFNTNQNSSNTQNYSNNTNLQNAREFGQVKEFRNQKDMGRDCQQQISSSINRHEAVTQEILNSAKNALPKGSDEFGTRTPCRENQSSKEKQKQRFDQGDNIRSDENFQEESLVLSGDRLEIGDRVPPSPAPSIHVDMQEYSSEEGSVLTKRTPKVGWTFYNNVLGQVNHILQNSPLQEEDLRNRRDPQLQELDKNVLIDTVKAATMDQLKKLGISFADNEREANANKKVTFDTSYYSRLNPDMNMMQGTSIMTETNTSMHMKALALKYLKEEQISDAMQQKQKRGALKNLMLSNVQGTTNMSFATMRYLQRYQLLPESMNGLIQDEGKENFQMPEISENPEPVLQKPRTNLQSRPAIAQASKTSFPSKILDISTLKQQPKLL